MVITPPPHFTPIYHFWEKRVAKLQIKSCCWQLNGGRRSVFIFSLKLDTNFMNLGQRAHKLWLLSLFYPIYHFWG